MTQVSYTDLGTKWILFSDIEDPAENVQYMIYNRGSYSFLALEAADTPTNDAGVEIKPGQKLIYEKGTQNLYLKAMYNDTVINVSKEG